MRRAVVHARCRAVVVRSAIGAVLGALVLFGMIYDGPRPGRIVSALAGTGRDVDRRATVAVRVVGGTERGTISAIGADVARVGSLRRVGVVVVVVVMSHHAGRVGDLATGVPIREVRVRQRVRDRERGSREAHEQGGQQRDEAERPGSAHAGIHAPHGRPR